VVGEVEIMKDAGSGYTLIELLVVVAIVSILATVAMGAYTNYIAEVRMAKLTHHYGEGVRAMRIEFAKRAAVMAQEGDMSSLTPITGLAAVRGIIDPQDASAPQGADAYVTDSNGSAGTLTGAVGVQLVSTTLGHEVIVFWRPNYLELPLASTRVDATEI
jgi:prepilin-type N-terminal cleavage/methylation domain-containing protein